MHWIRRWIAKKTMARVLSEMWRRHIKQMGKQSLNRRGRKRNANRTRTTIRKILRAFWDHGANTRTRKVLHDLMMNRKLRWMKYWRNDIDEIGYPKRNHWKRNQYCTVSQSLYWNASNYSLSFWLILLFTSVVKDPLDYQGRSFLHAPHDVGVNLRSRSHPDRCFLPKAHIHTWTGHTKGVSAIRLVPKTAHLLLSGSMDSRVKLWEVYNERRCIRTYFGHRQAVKDVAFNNTGAQFISAAYDRYIKLWDTETGDIVHRFTSKKIPFCVKFHPDRSKQHLFVAGTSDKKIICVSPIPVFLVSLLMSKSMSFVVVIFQWDTRSGEIVQEYDRHLGAVNSITFVDENRRFVTTSDDKSMRIWEWDIPVDVKYIADPTMHSMPSVTLAPNGKWLACQSLDNKICIFSALNRFKMNRKKVFTGHMVSGYACSLDFSPDMSYLVSGDGDGKAYIWDWKTTKLYKKWQAHEGVCISTLWHPHESSKLITAGWDGLIKYWD